MASFDLSDPHHSQQVTPVRDHCRRQGKCYSSCYTGARKHRERITSAVIEPGSGKRAPSAHAAIGLIAGALLYIVSLTGTVAVFYQELQRVEQPNAPEMNSISPEAVQKGVEAVLANEAGQPTTTHFYVHLPVKEVPRATATTDTQAV